MRIKIEAGAPKKECKCGSWLAHWEQSAKKKAAKCSVIGCATPAEIGSHVTKPSLGPVAFIVPLCPEHAAKTGETLDVAESIVFVRANKQPTCV